MNTSLPIDICLSWDMLEEYINEKMEPGAVSISLSQNQIPQITLRLPGYQLDLVHGSGEGGGGGGGIARMLGFQPFRAPSSGVFKEVSERQGNNNLVYSYFSGKIRVNDVNRLFHYRAFSSAVGSSVTYTISVPVGAYYPAELVAQLNSGAADNGHEDLVQIIGTPTTYEDRVSLKLNRFNGYVLLLEVSLDGCRPPPPSTQKQIRIAQHTPTPTHIRIALTPPTFQLCFYTAPPPNTQALFL